MDTFITPTPGLTELLAAASAASSLDQISTVIVHVRSWLADHPDDAGMRDILQSLMRAEHAHFA